MPLSFLRSAARGIALRAVLAVIGLVALVAAFGFALAASFMSLSPIVGPSLAAAIVALCCAVLAAILLWVALGRRRGDRSAGREALCDTSDEERVAQLLDSFHAGKTLGREMSSSGHRRTR